VVLSLAAAPAALAQGDDARYALAGGCYQLKSNALGRVVAGGDALRMQATQLGQYMFYGPKRDFLTGASDGTVSRASDGGPDGDWRVDGTTDNFTITLPSLGKALATTPGGDLTLVAPDAAGRFAFAGAQGCAIFPEVEINATGEPAKTETPWGEVRGLIDAHMHMMAFEFLGGRAHCGKPWDRYGVTHALVDCPDHYPNGAGAVLENTVSYGNPVGTHDPVGWPTFKDWPNHLSLTHENSYYKWLERAWRGGLRIFVNLFVENGQLCNAYPLKKNSCNEMDAVRLQHKRILELQDYIDAQNGGPGKGWFRIVTDPWQARNVIHEGKLAIVLGIEISRLFDCQTYDGVAKCDRAQIDRDLDEVYGYGVRDMELINKFDNALAGVAGDNGSTGVIVNNGNKLETDRYWQMQHCDTAPDADREQATTLTHNSDDLVANGLAALVPAGTAPVYPAPPHCNQLGLSDLGDYVVRRMMGRKMIVDPDHLSVRARSQVLSLLEAARYSGVVSSHSWSTPDAYPRIYKLGGVVTPYAGDSTSFVKAWRTLRTERDPRFYFGFGYGADMNGFGHQGGPRLGASNPVVYPFKSFDGTVTLDRERSGERVFDINKDGVAHYGLYPDWVEDLRKQAGDQIVEDMSRGSEAYLEMWERALGIPASQCRSPHLDVTSAGIGGVRLAASDQELLAAASQPATRGPRAWHWCVRGRGNGGAKVVSVLTLQGRVGLAASTARGHHARGIGPGARSSRLRGRSRSFGSGLRVRSTRGGRVLVYGVRGGRVRYVAVATRSVASSRKRLRSYLRLAGMMR